MRLIIKKVDHKNQSFSCIVGGKLTNFYLTNRLAKIFMLHLNENVLVDFDITNKTKKMLKSYQVAHFNLIKNFKTNEIIYDHHQLKLDMIDFLESNKYYLFLDLEMTMPFFKQKDFIPEIVQYGYFLVNEKGETILEDGNYVKAKLQKNINKRTIKFLKLDLDHYNENKVPFIKFYEKLENVVKKYQPKIVVWGKNDIQALNYGYNLYNLEPLTTDLDFVDLLKLHKDYFNLRNDLGLFKAYETYYNKEATQTHDAIDDAKVTKAVFDAFMSYTDNEIK